MFLYGASVSIFIIVARIASVASFANFHVFFCFIKLRAEMWQNVRYITLDILDSVSIIACVASDDIIVCDGLFMSIHFQDDEEYMREDNVACVAIVLLFPVLLVKL